MPIPLKTAHGKCPVCRYPVSFAQANFRRGKLFQCKKCSAQLRTGRVNLTLVVALFALGSYLGKQYGLIPVICLLILVVIVEWLTVTVAIAGEVPETAPQ